MTGVATRRTSPIELTAEDERAIDQALASVRAGKGVSLEEFREILRQADQHREGDDHAPPVSD